MKRTSIWRDTADTSNYTCLQINVTTEVAIIGGGITGITAAYLLGKAGISNTVLEAMRIGRGTTGFSTGNLYCTIDETLQSIRSKYDADKVKAVVQSRQGAVDLIKSIVREFDIDCELTEAPFYFFAEEENNISRVEKEAEAATAAGLKVTLETDIGLPFPIAKAIKLSGQAQFNPMKYIKQLSESLNNKVCTIYEGTKVTGYEKKDGAYSVTTEKGIVTAKHIILATHTPKGILGIHTLLFPYREYAVAYSYNGSYNPGIYWGIDKKNKHSIRHYRNGDENFVLVLGEKHKTGQNEHNLKSIDNLKDYAIKKFGVNMQRYQWGAQHYRAADGLATVGKADKDSEIYLATGFSTDGLTYGTMAAQIITDLITGKENSFADTYSPNRHHPLQSAPGFLKENVNVLVQYLKDIPGFGDADDFKDIQPGEGKVVAKNGEKIAAYRDTHNRLHLCSAVCTHMDCIVNWNEAELSWDCPCHGSRFNYDGTVLEGPAIADLPKKHNH
jgi:glycine/D-amino acid oxidase-like deaminating enzyme/nitrite reductase/ring-hydroxylating ferredoxin subunit